MSEFRLAQLRRNIDGAGRLDATARRHCCFRFGRFNQANWPGVLESCRRSRRLAVRIGPFIIELFASRPSPRQLHHAQISGFDRRCVFEFTTLGRQQRL